MNEEEFELDLDSIEANAEKKDRVKNRFEQLSTKVITISKEKDEAESKAKASEEARLSAEKEKDFYKGFSANVSKYPHASEFQDKILEKVKSGYDIEDAMVAVLAKEGKLSSQSQQVEQAPTYHHQAEGGSSQTIIAGNKSIDNMSREDKLAALQEADRSGDLARALMGR